MRNRILWRSAAGAALTAATLVGCYAEGNSYFLADGETQYFLTLEACEQEAQRPKYAGYECRGKLLWFVTSTKDFYAGAPTGR